MSINQYHEQRNEQKLSAGLFACQSQFIKPLARQGGGVLDWGGFVMTLSMGKRMGGLMVSISVGGAMVLKEGASKVQDFSSTVGEVGRVSGLASAG